MDRNWNAAEKISFGVLAIFFFLTSIRLRKLNIIKVHKYDFFLFLFLCFHFKIYENEICLMKKTQNYMVSPAIFSNDLGRK